MDDRAVGKTDTDNQADAFHLGATTGRPSAMSSTRSIDAIFTLNA